jgi:hypothetical protein
MAGYAFVAGLLAGCAFSRTPVPVTVAPGAGHPLKAPLKASVELGDIRDNRPVVDGLILLQKSNVNGLTTGAYVAERPVADIFGDSLNAALRQNGFEATNETHYVLRCDLESFEYVSQPPGLTAKALFYVRVELRKPASGPAIWHKTYAGQSGENRFWGTGKALGQDFSEAAADLIARLISDREFRDHFEQSP